jgi:integrase
VTKAALIRHPGVLRRPDSNTYQFGLRVPTELRKHFRSPWALRCSLGTADLREANDKAKALQAEWAVRFESLRSGKPIPFDAVALRAKLLAYTETFVLQVDRLSAGLTPAERALRARDAAWQRDDARQEHAEGRVPDWAGQWLDAMGYVRSPFADAEAMPHLVMLLELYHEALSDLSRTYPLRVERMSARRALVAADGPSILSASQASAKKSDASGYRIAHALKAWAAVARPAKTVGAFTRHANHFEALAGDPVLSSIDKMAAIRFRDALQAWAVANGKTASTADNVLVSIRALVNVARDRGWIEGNPFERLTVDVGGKESEGREPWTHDELRTLFADPIWTAYRLPNDRKAGGDAAYWIPLLACFTGARLSEIAQLWTDDLSLSPGKEVIEFRGNVDRRQALKNDGSWRAVPMHSELVRLGLPDYVNSLPRGSLFPALPTDGKNGAGGQFGQWFGNFKRSKGFDSPTKTLHSFRHLMATELRLAGATDAQADAITGHAGQGVGRTVYAATIRRQAERLRAVIELLRFPGLSLPAHRSKSLRRQ